MKYLLFVGLFSWGVLAAEPGLVPSNPSDIEAVRKRLYPGGRDEEDLKVMATFPEALRKTDERAIQKQVYKSLFNEELSEQSGEAAEPEVEQ